MSDGTNLPQTVSPEEREKWERSAKLEMVAHVALKLLCSPRSFSVEEAFDWAEQYQAEKARRHKSGMADG